MDIAPLDLALLVLYLGGTIAFGLWMGRGQKTANDYLLGGRDLPWWALLLSIVATETSTATFLSVPAYAYSAQFGGTGDLRFLQLPLGYLVGRTIAAYALLPLFFKGEMFTAYDVLRQRSGPHVRTLASGLFLVTRTLADGLRLYLTAVVLQVMFGWSLPLSVLVTGLGTVAYTVIGGIKAVVWTDVMQFVVYMLGAGVALLVIGQEVGGGLGTVFADAQQAGRLRVFDFALDFGKEHTFWSGLIGGAVLTMGSHGVDQMIVQRYLSARNLRDARLALLWSGPVVLLQFTLFLAIGLALSHFYSVHPPANPFQNGDRVFADFIVHHLPTGLVGIVLGAVFSAAMSTLSSSLSASASALVNDFLLPATGHATDSPFALRAAKLATIGFCALQIAVGVIDYRTDGEQSPIVGRVLAIATNTTGIILGLFALAMLRHRSPRASLCGLCAGIAAMGCVVFVLPACAIKLAWPWHGLVTSSATLLVGSLVARVTAK